MTATDVCSKLEQCGSLCFIHQIHPEKVRRQVEERGSELVTPNAELWGLVHGCVDKDDDHFILRTPVRRKALQTDDRIASLAVVIKWGLD